MYKGFKGIKYDESGIKIGINRILTNPYNPVYLNKLCEGIDRPTRVHIFYTNPHDADHVGDIVRRIEEEINNEDGTLRRYLESPLKIYIHHDKKNRDIGIMLRCLIPNANNIRCQVIPEGRPVRFAIPGAPIGVDPSDRRFVWSTQDLVIEMDGYRISMEVDARIKSRMYDANFMKKDTDRSGAITSEEQRMHPEFFRDGIINRFKANTPPEILKSFQGDDDIWDYINCQGAWRIDKQ